MAVSPHRLARRQYRFNFFDGPGAEDQATVFPRCSNSLGLFKRPLSIK